MAYRPRGSSWIFAFDLGYLQYGRESRSEFLSPVIPELIVDVVTTYSLLLGHALVRFSPLKGTFQPYAEGLVGFKYFETETSIGDYSYYYWSGIRSKNADDWLLSYGLGAGVSCRLVQIKKSKRYI